MIELSGGLVSVSVTDAQKAADAMGESVQIIGSFEGLTAP
jgi:hypothetical protein